MSIEAPKQFKLFVNIVDAPLRLEDAKLTLTSQIADLNKRKKPIYPEQFDIPEMITHNKIEGGADLGTVETPDPIIMAKTNDHERRRAPDLDMMRNVPDWGTARVSTLIVTLTIIGIDPETATDEVIINSNEDAV